MPLPRRRYPCLRPGLTFHPIETYSCILQKWASHDLARLIALQLCWRRSPTFHPWSPPHPISGKPEQPKVYARKTPENSGKPEQPKVYARTLTKKLLFSGVFRVFRSFLGCLGFPGFSGVFRIVFQVFRVFRNQEGVVAKNPTFMQ